MMVEVDFYGCDCGQDHVVEVVAPDTVVVMDLVTDCGVAFEAEVWPYEDC